MLLETEVFLDTAYAIALSAPGDQFHDQAVRLAERMEAERTRIVTTRAVFLKIGNALAKQRHRSDAIALLETLEADRNVEIVPVTEDLVEDAFALYRSRPDKEWGLIDCASFVVMVERRITGTLTTDDPKRFCPVTSRRQ